MKLEDQVISLELAKQLKGLGFEQKSLFYWCKAKFDATGIEFDSWYLRGINTSGLPHNNHSQFARPNSKYWSDYASAYTVAELGEMLPYELETKDNFYALSIDKADNNLWGVIYSNLRQVESELPKVTLTIDRILESTMDISLAEAMGQMLIHLVEQGIIKPEEL